MNGVGHLSGGSSRRLPVSLRGFGGMALLLLCLFALPANAGFTGYYALNNFSLVNVNADGYAESLFGGAVVILYGGNNGSGLSGTTDLVIDAKADGIVSFQYAYSSFDDPGFDWAGYLLKGSFVVLVDTDGQGGVVQFPVMAGDSFGFRVMTDDNTVAPGILTLSQFSAPGSTSAVPEPATVWLFAAAGVLFLAGRKRRR